MVGGEVVVVIGVIVKCGGVLAVALWASARPIAPRHLRNISWILSPSLVGDLGMMTLGYSSPCGTEKLHA